LQLQLIRPYYGVNVHGDMHGDLGIADYSPEVFPDLTLVFAATVASRNLAVNVNVIDANAEKLYPLQVIKRIKPEAAVIIVKAAAATIKFDLEFTRQLKKYFPENKLIVGGHIAKLLRHWISGNVPEIDGVADFPIEYYVASLVNGKKAATRISDLPQPDYTLFPYQKYLNTDGQLRGCLYMSRGCPAGCAYCPYASFYGKNIEFRPPEQVLEDIKALLRLGIKVILFRDQYFTFNQQNVIKLCSLIIAQKIHFKWRCETRIDSLSFELIDLMVKAGLELIGFGIESASAETLAEFKRPGNNLAKIKANTDYLNQKGVTTLAFYIIGFPNDTWEKIHDTYKLALQINSTCAKFSIFSQCSAAASTTKLTPDCFVPFENVMTQNPCRNLSQAELRYAVNQLMIAYHSETVGMKDAYDFHYVNQSRLEEFLKRVKDQAHHQSVLEFQKIS
jgi:tRNA A37 methylthiotransferase MiaB